MGELLLPRKLFSEMMVEKIDEPTTSISITLVAKEKLVKVFPVIFIVDEERQYPRILVSSQILPLKVPER